MKLIKQPTVFVVTSKYEHEGYEENREYRFARIEDVLNFLNDEIVYDIYKDIRFKNYYELVNNVYEKNEYELDWEFEKEDDYIWKVQ